MIRVSYSSNIQAPQERHVFSKRVYGARITLMEQKNAWLIFPPITPAGVCLHPPQPPALTKRYASCEPSFIAESVEEQPVKATATPARAANCRDFRFFIRTTFGCGGAVLNKRGPWLRGRVFCVWRSRWKLWGVQADACGGDRWKD